MKRLFLPLFLFLFLILEGVALELLPVDLITGELVIVPHWVFIFLVLIAIFYDKEDTYYSVLYGFIFGLLVDIVYTGVLGVYMFSYALVIYVVHGLKKMLHGNVFVSILLTIVGVSLADISIKIIYTVAGIASMVWEDYLLYRLLPTIISNLVFLLVLYPILAKQLVRWGRDQLSSNNSL